MKYTEYGKTGLKLSKLGFGCMRFPSQEKDGKKLFDEEESIRMIHRAMELGVNYFDTAPFYCESQSETILGKALKGKRKDVYVSTKYPQENASGEDFMQRLELSLKKLDTDYIDFYHLWGIDLKDFLEKSLMEDGPVARAKKMKEQGVIRHISFSYHDDPGNMIEIIKRSEGIFSSVLCQYNLMDRSLEKDIAFAHEQGLGVAIMGPVGGGRLGAPSPAIQELLEGKRASSPEIALRFVLNNPNVNMALSGMSSMAQVEQNAALMDTLKPLTAEESARIDTMMEENKRLAELYCTGCNYCMPCPAGINIPEIFTIMNNHRVYGITDYAKAQYAEIGKVDWRNYKDASACVDCGACEGKCPQKLPIREQLRQTHEALGAR